MPEESIVDFKQVAESYLNDIKNAGGSIILKSRVVDIKLENNYALINSSLSLFYRNFLNLAKLK